MTQFDRRFVVVSKFALSNFWTQLLLKFTRSNISISRNTPRKIIGSKNWIVCVSQCTSYSLNICLSRCFPYTAGQSFLSTNTYKLSIFERSVTCRFFPELCSPIDMNSGKMFEDLFLIKIADKGTTLNGKHTNTLDIGLITLCMKLPWFCHTNSGQFFRNCSLFVIALVPYFVREISSCF